MEGTTVNLGSITVVRKNSPLSLELTASFLIDSDTTALGLNQLTATDLFHHSKDGNLWMAKSGSCQLVFKTFINGQLPDSNVIHPPVISSLTGMAAECSLWGELGLELKAKHLPLPFGSQEEDQKSETSYFLCHPDLSSEMIVPHTLTCVKFKGLSCNINLRLDTSWRRAGEPKRPSKMADEEIAQVGLEPPVVEEFRAGVRKNPRRITRTVNVKYTGTSQRQAKKACPATQPDLENSNSDPVILLSISEEEKKEMALLLDAALRKLIGVKHTFPGVKVTEDRQSPSLIEIAPAVWNLRYLQSMAAHAQTIPAIANGLARLRSARSAMLRDKVNKLRGAGAEDEAISSTLSHSDDLEDGIGKEVEKRLWSLCQTSIHVKPASKTGKRKAKGNGDAPADTQEEEILEGFTQLTDDGWVNHHPSLTHDYHPFDLLEQGANTNTDMDTHTDVVEYDYQYQFEIVALLGDHSEEETYGDDRVEEWYDVEGEDMALDELQPSSEGDYVYADGLGRLHPISRHQAFQTRLMCGPTLASNELHFEEMEEDDGEEFGDPEEYLGEYLEWDSA
ncbi:hypothetical protein QR685DRAFT_261364 [Neurospora intermedia]|uniref:Uncharacterized protein n=1 Tax=Neurospora intermedia TaxID=5142 RepID=A0ABR3DEJ2_NEUIN